MAENIRELLEKQKLAVAEISAQIEVIEQSDLIAENQALAQRYEKLHARYETAEEARRALSVENTGLKTALYEQYYNEKIQLVVQTRRELEIFFASKAAGEQNRLTALEKEIQQRINHTLAELQKNRVDTGGELYMKLTELQTEARDQIAEARAKLVNALADEEKAELERLKDEALDGDQVAALSQKNNLERLIGLNLLNIIGIVLIIIGVIAAGQFAYLRMGAFWRSMALFALGLIFLIAGEMINRRRPNIFSLGITAGGVGILYAALAVSYFGLQTLDMYAALILCVTITAIAFFLSTRYNAQVLLAMALVGGYLPIFSIGPERALLFSMMGYFVLLNLLALSVAFRKKWTVASFVGLGLNLLGAVYVSTLIWYIHPLSERIFEITYIGFAILIYTAIPLISTYMAKARFQVSDVVLLAINTVIGSCILFANLNGAGWGNYLGLASVLFAVVYAATGYVVARRFQEEKQMSALFYITGLTFCVLFVPFQLDSIWFTLGWLVLGTALCLYGIIRERRGFRISGFIVNGISLAWFVLADISAWNMGHNTLFPWQYLAVTAASILIMGAFLYKKAIYSNLQKAFKYSTAGNLWLYALFLISRLSNILHDTFPGAHLDLNYLILALACVATLILAIVFLRIPILFDRGMKIIAVSLHGIGIAGIALLHLAMSPLSAPMGGQPGGIVILATVILIAVGAVGAFAVYDLTRRVVLDGVLGIQYLPLLVSAYIVALLTINLIRIYDLAFSSFWISIVYVLAALLWTILGFVKRYALLRRFGLGLALFSVAKLFLIDLTTQTQGFRILSYFILGAILVGISYVYQYFNKRLETFEVSGEE